MSLARLSRQGYFKGIKRANNSHWVDFLAKTTPHNIWTAKKFVAPRKTPRFPELPGANSQVEINEALLSHFFPPQRELRARGRLRRHPSASPLTKRRSRALWPNTPLDQHRAPKGSHSQSGRW